jgi:hypothetical protein
MTGSAPPDDRLREAIQTVGWAKRSVPTMTEREKDCGHGADAPLPTLRILSLRAKRSNPEKNKLDRFVAEFIIGPAKAGPVGSSQ